MQGMAVLGFNSVRCHVCNLPPTRQSPPSRTVVLVAGGGMQANTVIRPADYDLRALLESNGAIPPRYGHGKWDCPRCGFRACLSVHLDRGLYHCFHAGCDFSGNAHELARQLGLTGRLSRQEYFQLRRHHERADKVARQLYALWKPRWFDLLDWLHKLDELKVAAQQLGPTNPVAWDVLEIVYSQRRAIIPELMILESASPSVLIEFLIGDTKLCHSIADGVIFNGGLYDGKGRFVELTP